MHILAKILQIRNHTLAIFYSSRINKSLRRDEHPFVILVEYHRRRLEAMDYLGCQKNKNNNKEISKYIIKNKNKKKTISWIWIFINHAHDLNKKGLTKSVCSLIAQPEKAR